MPKWAPKPPDKLFYQKDQQDFLAARRKRICRNCKDPDGTPFEYEVVAPIFHCPKCDMKGIRAYERLCIIAGRRFGKTVCGSLAGLEEATIPNSIGWCCAPTNPKLHRYVIPAFQKLIPPEWVKDWSSEYGDLTLKNGSLIHFQTLEDPDQGRGQGLDWLWIDEVCELTKAHWDVIRPSLGDKQGVAFFTTSPRSHDWVWKLLYKPALDSKAGHWALHAKTADNPLFHTSDGKAFLARERDQMSDEMFRQEYEADFVDFKGSVYGSSLHGQVITSEDVLRKFIPEWPQLDPSRPVTVGVDTGADHPFGGVKVVSTENGLVVIGEYLERHRTFVEHATALKALAANPKARYAINKNERQPMLELAQHGIFCQPAENDVVAGTERVKTWLQAKQLFIYEPTCPQTVEQMKTYRWADNYSPKDESKRAEKVYKKDDELPDCLRYMVMTWPQLPNPAVAESKPRDISHLSPEMQHSIERLRRIDNPPKQPVESTTAEDFWA